MVLNAFQLVRPRGSTSDTSPEPINSSGRRPVDQLTLEGDFIRTWPSGKEAARALGSKFSGSISSCASGRFPTALGFKWRYSKGGANA
jgi:hypothetical protein